MKSAQACALAAILSVGAAPQEGEVLPEGAVRRLGTLHWKADRLQKRFAAIPGKDQFLTGGDDGTVFLRELKTGSAIREWKRGDKEIRTLHVSGDGSRVLTRCQDGNLTLWALETGAVLQVFPESSNELQVAAVSDDGRHVVTAQKEGRVDVWEVGRDKPARSFETARQGRVRMVRSRGLERLLTLSEGGWVESWDWRTGESLARVQLKGAGQTTLAISPDGEKVITGGTDTQTIVCWELKTGKRLWSYKHPISHMPIVLFGPEGRRVLSKAHYHLAALDAAAGRPLFQRRLFSFWEASYADFMPDGERILSVGDPALDLLEAKTGRLLNETPGHRGPLGAISVSPNGLHLLTAGQLGEMILWNLESGREVRRLQDPHAIAGTFQVVMGADGMTAMADRPGVDWPEARIWNLETGRWVGYHQCGRGGTRLYERRVPEGKPPLIPEDLAAMTADGTMGLTVGEQSSVAVWDLVRLKRVRMFVAEKARPTALALHPTGRHALTGLDDGTLALWDAGTGETLRRFGKHDAWVRFAAFHPDGQHAVTAGFDGIMIWDLKTGKQARHLSPDTPDLFSLALSPDGHFAAAGHGNGKVVFWDLVAGKRLREFQAHRRGVSALAFSRGGRRLFTGSFDSTVMEWKVGGSGPEPPRSLQEAASRLASDNFDAWSSAREVVLRSGSAALPVLIEKFPPTAVKSRPADRAKLEAILEKLEGDRFEDREAAMRQLTSFPEEIGEWLREKLGDERGHSIEAHVRLKMVAEARVDREALRSGAGSLRAVMAVLEMTDGAEVQRALQRYAGGDPALASTELSRLALKSAASRFLLERNGAVNLVNEGNREGVDSASAIRCFSRAVELDPKYGRAYAERALEWRKKGDLEKALQDAGRAVEAESGRSEGYYARADVLNEQGRYDRAVEDYSQAILLDPVRWNYCYDRGCNYLKMKDYDRAIADFSRSIELHDCDPHSYFNRAQALYRKRNFRGAVADYDEAIKRCLPDAGLFSARGCAYHDLKDYDRALADFEKAVQLSPRTGRFYTNRAAARLAKGLIDPACEDVLRAIDLDPKEPANYGNLGWIWMTRRDYAKAADAVAREIELDPGRAVGYQDRGRLKFLMSDPEGALKDFGKAQEIDPAEEDIPAWRAYLLGLLNRPDEGLVEARKAVSLKEDESWPHTALAYCLDLKGRREEALRSADKAVDVEKEAVGMARFVRGTILAKAGRKEEAVRDLEAWLEKVRVYWRYEPVEKQARELLKSLKGP